MLLRDVIEEHFEETAFLWELRQSALASRRFDFHWLAAMEERILAHVDGLVIGGEEAWEIIRPGLHSEEVGEAFAAAFAALEAGNSDRINDVCRVVESTPLEFLEGVCLAFCHTRHPGIEELIAPLLNSGKEEALAAAIDVLSFRRVATAPGLLCILFDSKESAMTAFAVRAAGRLRLMALASHVARALDSPSPLVRREAMRAGALLGIDEAATRARTAVREGAEEAQDALRLLGLLGRRQDLDLLVKALVRPKLARAACRALGAWGYVSAVEPLLDAAASPFLARIAAAALQQIAGLDMKAENLERESPEKGPAVPEERTETGDSEEEEADQEAESDPDEGLPYPDNAGLIEWWRSNAPRFDKTVRYRLGEPHSAQALFELLGERSLGERHDAAMELALTSRAMPLLETRALAGVQEAKLADIGGIVLNPGTNSHRGQTS